ncbi:MAG: OmpH family outer membrane protein [Candidatus Tectomicrobia bacterium]|uniref:OmpH family outer membrane protein n=1 Tax=Tectimicrobiota bacterium TaxID=2528274 RepID=A0A932GS16_UNCTE|nr:OmpH family outer membrane protein [Candidatus Tectomicrobia bacterium]
MTQLGRVGKAALLLGALAGFTGLSMLPGAVAEGAERPVKIAVVDMNRVLNESSPGKQAMAELQRAKEKTQTEIDRREEEVRRLQNEIRTQGLILSEAVRREKETTYRKKLRDAQRFVDDANEELGIRERDATQKVLVEIRKVIQQIGKEQGYTLIAERRDGIYYVGEGTDFTDEVIRRVNASSKR